MMVKEMFSNTIDNMLIGTLIAMLFAINPMFTIGLIVGVISSVIVIAFVLGHGYKFDWKWKKKK